VEQAQAILESIGIEGERVQMYNLSSAEGPRFAEYALEMDQRIRRLGPSPIKRGRSQAA
jgi:coenzyme F420-reducing hydrogenase delta subunit